MNPAEAAERAGLTYRQVDHWISLGWVNASDPHPGSGNLRQIADAEADALKWAALLVKHGLSPQPAISAGRQLVDRGWADLGLFVISTRIPKEVAA